MKIKGILVLALIGFLGWLYASARQGDVTSIVILVVLAAVLLILLGIATVLLVLHFDARRKQADFAQHVHENLATMGRLQSIQNQQNAMLMRQVRALPPGDTVDAQQTRIVFDEGLFRDLEGAENNFLQAED